MWLIFQLELCWVRLSRKLAQIGLHQVAESYAAPLQRSDFVLMYRYQRNHFIWDELSHRLCEIDCAQDTGPKFCAQLAVRSLEEGDRTLEIAKDSFR